MNETEFQQQADQMLLALERAVEDSGADIEFETVADILTLEFSNGSRIIINKQAPARQIWVAARSGGFHYGYDPARQAWVNDRSGRELRAELTELATEQAGEPVRLV
ncbi:MAG TPA: iron donor protein CyaY [Acidiferrobacteraceae bacterium]|nr:iron donor protein CyaY [Acidiferrobacteraceae bacterium]